MVYPSLRFKPRLAVLSQEQIEQIHLATLEVLERTGVQITHPQKRFFRRVVPVKPPSQSGEPLQLVLKVG